MKQREILDWAMQGIIYEKQIQEKRMKKGYPEAEEQVCELSVKLRVLTKLLAALEEE